MDKTDLNEHGERHSIHDWRQHNKPSRMEPVKYDWATKYRNNAQQLLDSRRDLNEDAKQFPLEAVCTKNVKKTR